MLPDLSLTATLNGEPREFLAREVPTAVFFLGFQDTYPGADCFPTDRRRQQDVLSAMDAWSDGLLCRAMVEPRLTPELVQRLGWVRDELVLAYLGAIGWTPAPPDLPPARRLDSATRGTRGEDAAAFVAVPPSTLKIAIREISHKARTAPYIVWTRWGISEFIWTWRVVLQDELKKRGGRNGGPPTSLVELVGREGS